MIRQVLRARVRVVRVRVKAEHSNILLSFNGEYRDERWICGIRRIPLLAHPYKVALHTWLSEFVSS